MDLKNVVLVFKQKTAYEMSISDWSSDVCSSDLLGPLRLGIFVPFAGDALERLPPCLNVFLNPELLRHVWIPAFAENRIGLVALVARIGQRDERIGAEGHALLLDVVIVVQRSEENTSELQSLMRISFAVFCL